MNADAIRALAALLSAAPVGQALHIAEMILEITLIVLKDTPDAIRRNNIQELHDGIGAVRDVFAKLTPTP